jgi:hypothetical protein
MLLQLDLRRSRMGNPRGSGTIAIPALDWEDKLGLGMECPRATRTFYALETRLLGWAQRNPETFRHRRQKAGYRFALSGLRFTASPLASSMLTQTPGSLA